MQTIPNQVAPFNPERDQLPIILAGEGVTSACIATLLVALNSAAARRCNNRWARERLHIATQAALDAAQCLARIEARNPQGALHG